MPGTRCLLETIESLDHTTQMLWLRRINKPRWLTHVHLLLKNNMEESILNIELAFVTASERSKRIVVGLTTGLKVSS
jgi:hypothetical protein